MFARTERLLLRPGFPEDAPALFRAIADEGIVRITMCRPARRNALSREHLTQLLAAVTEVGGSDATPST